MTKQELIEITGDEEQAEYAIEIILKSLKKNFVRTVITSELKEIEKEIKELANEGIIYCANGHEHVSWNPDNDREKCFLANGLLYQRNRVNSLIAAR